MRRRRGGAFALAFGEALRFVAEDYASFVRNLPTPEPGEDPRLFGQRHAAAKTCLSHLSDLLELIGEEAGLEPVRDGFALLHEAQAALGPPPLMIEDDSAHDEPGDDGTDAIPGDEDGAGGDRRAGPAPSA